MDEYLPILGVETSGEVCSVCLYINEKKYAEKNLLDKYIHSEKIITVIDDVLHSLENITEVRSIAVSIGPGSFTGLRIGLATVKGIAIGKNIPVIPVPTMQAHALGIIPFLNEKETFAVVNTVNRDEVYFTKFGKKGNTAEVITGPRLLNNDSVLQNMNPGEKLFGSYSADNSENYSYQPTALNICRWAYFFGKELLTFDHDYLEPDYLKNFVAKGRIS